MNKKYDNIILFDGVCNLCNSTVRFIIKRDQKSIFKFTPIQSPIAQNILSENGAQNSDLDSFVLIEDGKKHIKSTAGLKVLKMLGWPLNIFYIFIIIPAPIRDVVYNLIAKSRYKVFGKKESCMVPLPEYTDRFIE